MDNSVIDEYLDKIEKPQRRELEKIRTLVHKLVPEAVEIISYGIPGFKYKGKYLLGFAAYKNHLSLFPTSGPIENLTEKLKGYKTAKGTIRFDLNKPLPEALIKEIIRDRVSGITKV